MEKSHLVVAGLIAVVGLSLRCTLSLHSYSGEGKEPMFGDFEAQRHWQEVTVHLPAREWYQQTPDNDLGYWGLDYPPLTAYHSLANGLVAQHLNSSYVEMKLSRGIETEEHKYFMRLTVLLVDALLYLPCMYVAIRTVQQRFLIKSQRTWLAYTAVVLFPGQLLIDNGHFQYNNASLGLFMLSMALLLQSRFSWGALVFTLALNYKQMELYHSLPIFFFLLAQCLPRLSANDSRAPVTFGRGLLRLIKIGATVVVATTILYLPWLSHLEDIKQVLFRLFPIARGVFEDKVANFWCIANVFHKIKEHYSNEEMAKICLLTTLAAALPTNIFLFFKASAQNLLQSLVITSLAFFLFSFQVHEKTILLVTAPVLLLLPVVREKKWLILLLQTATFSMTPLLRKDGLIGAYFALSIIFLLSLVLLNELYAADNGPDGRWEVLKLFICISSLLAQCVLVLALVFVTPPTQYPFLFELLISAFSAGHFLLFFVYFYAQQLFVKTLLVE